MLARLVGEAQLFCDSTQQVVGGSEARVQLDRATQRLVRRHRLSGVEERHRQIEPCGRIVCGDLRRAMPLEHRVGGTAVLIVHGCQVGVGHHETQVVLERLLIPNDGTVTVSGQLMQPRKNEAIIVVVQRHVHDLVALHLLEGPV